MSHISSIATTVAKITAAMLLVSVMPCMADTANKVINTTMDSDAQKVLAKQVSKKHFYSISYLKNINDFQLLNNEDTNVITLEYAGKYGWGDSFVFFDKLVASEDGFSPKKQTNYLEASARLSIPYLFNQLTTSALVTRQPVIAKYVKDYFVAGMVEYSYVNVSVVHSNSSTTINNLLGFGIAWYSDFFSYLNTNFYYANNEKQADDYQLTVSFAKEFTIADFAFKTNGYIDWSTATTNHKASFHFSPQILLDLGQVFNHPKRFYIGIEYSYWRNKFGLANVDDEHTISAMIKFSF